MTLTNFTIFKAYRLYPVVVGKRAAKPLESVFEHRDLDSVVNNALACHLCDPGSNPGQGMWQGSGRRLGSVVFPGFSGFLYLV